MSFSKRAYRLAQLRRWQVAGRTAHFWHNQKAIERARTEIIKWKALLAQLGPAAVSTANYSMFDAIEVSQIPGYASAVAGYVGGHWPTYNELLRRFPAAKHLSIAIAASEDADCLDVEQGDASPSEAGPWAKRQKARGKRLVVLYFSVSNRSAVEASLNANGIRRSEVRFWGAHYTYVPHIEPGFDAIQWTDKALGRNLDQSLCTAGFLRTT